MTEPPVAPERTLAIILGASAWPKATGLPPSKSFAHSARDFSAYLRASAPRGFGLDSQNLLNLFDSDEEAIAILDRIADFMQERRKALELVNQRLRDLIVYYVGHGGIDSASSDAFYFAIRRTRERDRFVSSLSAAALARTLRSEARGERRFLILDCCFAGAAAEAFIPQSQFADALQKKVRMEFPARGTALLCAASSADRARAPGDARHTMFSGALIDVLRSGYAGDRAAFLSLEAIHEAVSSRIKELYRDSVRPEVHCPDQREGPLSHVPIFRNPAARPGAADGAGREVAVVPPGQPVERPAKRASALARRDRKGRNEKPAATAEAVGDDHAGKYAVGAAVGAVGLALLQRWWKRRR
jgi:hypothetical protein